MSHTWTVGDTTFIGTADLSVIEIVVGDRITVPGYNLLAFMEARRRLMSHAWTVGDTRFSGNADLSGDIEIVVRGNRISVPGCDLLAFMDAIIAGYDLGTKDVVTVEDILNATGPFRR